LEQELGQALTDAQPIREEISRKFPRYADLKNPRPVNCQDIQGVLQPDEAVLSYFVTSHRTALWVLDRERVELKVLPWGRQAVREQVRTLNQGIQALDVILAASAHPPNQHLTLGEVQAKVASFDLTEAHSLYQKLVGPAAEVLAGKRLVWLAPDDLLYQLPFEALLTRPPASTGLETGSGGEQFTRAPFWVLSQSLSYLPSLSVLRSLRTLTKSPPSLQAALVAFADPIFEEENGLTGSTATTRQARLQMLRRGGAFRAGKLDRLLDTAEEARRAAQALGSREEDIYLQKRATEHNVKRLPLSSFRILLFATHGLMAGEFRPGLQPALALSFVGDPDNDGLLEMGEILGLDLRAHLVVLSACNTGRSAAPEDRGEGFAGLTRSFMYAGAASLVVTLWSVESESAMRLMGDFYARLKNQERACALAEAKRAMIAGGGSLPLSQGVQLPLAHPFFWAPYIVVGEGR
jgi:CHAT domain-containing protein